MSENAITIWDIVKSISEGTEEVFDEEIYNPFIVTMALGQHADLVLTANEVNQRSNLTKRQHYDFLFNLVRKKKRFSKWQKRLDEPKLNMIQSAFGFSHRKAVDALKILSESQLQEIDGYLKTYQGGLKKK
jgi:hypothetical protein